MSVFKKVQEMRVELQEINLKKSGENKFAGFRYYELGDILPHINLMMLDHGLVSETKFTAEKATMRVFEADNPDIVMETESPMGSITLKGCNEIQSIGAAQTYLRRYLWLTMLEICEHDSLDATAGKDTPAKPAKTPTKPAKPQVEEPTNPVWKELRVSIEINPEWFKMACTELKVKPAQVNTLELAKAVCRKIGEIADKQ